VWKDEGWKDEGWGRVSRVWKDAGWKDEGCGRMKGGQMRVRRLTQIREGIAGEGGHMLRSLRPRYQTRTLHQRTSKQRERSLVSNESRNGT
jgi:hypothetical protein